jgi:hypothetical protein
VSAPVSVPEDAPVADESTKAPEEQAPPERFGSKLFDHARRAREQAAAKASGLATRAGELTEQAAARAGEITGQAAARAGELTEQAAARAGELKEQAAARAGDVKDQVAARATELKDAGWSRVGETLDEFNAALPAVREAGYTLAEVDIQIGLPPKVVAKFATAPEIPDEKAEALLAAHADERLTALLLRALFQASRLQAKIKIAGLKAKGMEVEIGLTPHVTVKFG